MDPPSIKPQVETLADQIDDLEDALEPLLKTPPNQLAAKLPLLDKSKLFVSTAYAIESLIFSTLLLHGQKAKEHPIFTELTRLRQYHTKIRDAESRPEPRSKLDKSAAARFIKHGLSGNDRYDAERAGRIAKEKENWKGRHIRFEEEKTGEKGVLGKAEQSVGKKRKAEEGTVVEEEESDKDENSDAPVLDVDAEAADQDIERPQSSKRKGKKPRVSGVTKTDEMDVDQKQEEGKDWTKIATKEERQRQKEQIREEKRMMRKAKQPLAQAVQRNLEREEEVIIPTKEDSQKQGYSEALTQFLERPKKEISGKKGKRR